MGMEIVDFKMNILVLLEFIILSLFLWRNKKYKSKKNISVWHNILLIFNSGLILFVYLESVYKIQGVNLHFLDRLLIIISTLGTTFLSGEISKNIISFVMKRSFSSKYGGRELTDKEKDNLRKNKNIFSALWNYILTFIICAILYSIMDSFIFYLYEIKDTLTISFISTICYWFIFDEK